MSANYELAKMAVASLAAKDRAALLRELVPEQPTELRIVRRNEAARLLAVSKRTVDHYSEQGLLEKVKLPGRRRASGFRLTDLQHLIGGAA